MIRLLYIDLFCGAGGTQSEQKKFIGNAVEVGMARQLCETLANCVRV